MRCQQCTQEIKQKLLTVLCTVFVLTQPERAGEIFTFGSMSTITARAVGGPSPDSPR